MKTNIFLDLYKSDSDFKEDVDYFIKIQKSHNKNMMSDNPPFVEIISNLYLNIMIERDTTVDMIHGIYKRFTRRITTLDTRTYDLSILRSVIMCIAIRKEIDRFYPSYDISGVAKAAIMDHLILVLFEFAKCRRFITQDILDILCITVTEIKNRTIESVGVDNSIVPSLLYNTMYDVYAENGICTDDLECLLELNDLTSPYVDYFKSSEYYKK